MKRRAIFIVALILVMLATVAGADPARFLNQDKNPEYHWRHLQQHVGTQNCMVSGNYIKVRPDAGSKKVIGHLEKADAFTLDAVQDGWAKITVVYHAETSPDSYTGLSGWVNADYVECPCSSDEYYNGPARITYSLATVTSQTGNLREEPTKSAPNHARIQRGEQVEVLSEYTGKDNRIWYRVRYGMKVGFLRADMVEITQSGIPEAVVSPADQTIGINIDPDFSDSLFNSTSQNDNSDTDKSAWQDVYHDFILNRKYRVSQAYADDPALYADIFGNVYDTSSYSSIGFGLHDIDQDGIPELIADNGYPDGGWSETHIYTCRNGQIHYLGSVSDRAGGPCITNLPDYPGVITSSGNMGYFSTEYTVLLQNGVLHSEIVFSEDYNDPAEEGGWLEKPIIEIVTADEQLYQVIHDGTLVDIAWYKEADASESTWPSFIASGKK